MKTIAIFTTTRADLGIFSALIRAIQTHETLDYLLFAGGSHLAPEQGRTITEIETLKFKLTATFDYLLNEDSSASLSRAMGIAALQLTEIFQRFSFDFVCVLGDRVELLPIVMTAILFKKPIIHIHGGERSTGVIDEQVRHMITKAAHIHFASCQAYADTIQKMGEASWRVFNTGALAVDNIQYYPPIPKDILFKELTLNPNFPVIILTYHPVTLEFALSPEEQVDNLFSALETEKDLQVVVTSPGMDVGREKIACRIKARVAQHPLYHYFESLGVRSYFSLIPHCLFVIGNSSSGMIEVPFFKIPTIDIGDRQKGRLRHTNIIHTDYSSQSIREGIQKAKDPDFRETLKNMEYRFGDGNAGKKMIHVLETLTVNEHLIRKEYDYSE